MTRVQFTLIDDVEPLRAQGNGQCIIDASLDGRQI